MEALSSAQSGEPWGLVLNVEAWGLGCGGAWSLVRCEMPWGLEGGETWGSEDDETWGLEGGETWGLEGGETWGTGQSVVSWVPGLSVEAWGQEQYEEPCGPEGGEPTLLWCEQPWTLGRGQAGPPLCPGLGVGPWLQEHCGGTWGVV